MLWLHAGIDRPIRLVHKSVDRVLHGENPGLVADEDHGTWYREMFAPSVTAGLLRAADLAGYRNGQVYIRRSTHVPLNREAVRDAMPAFFDLLRQETDPAVRVVLGHFVILYSCTSILNMDGNGRMGRFLMNLMLASGGYPLDCHTRRRPQKFIWRPSKKRVSAWTLFRLQISWPAWLRKDLPRTAACGSEGFFKRDGGKKGDAVGWLPYQN